MKLFSNTFNILGKGMDYSFAKEKAISNNIANVDTPYYKAKEVSFKSELNNAMGVEASRTNNRHYDFSTTDRNSFIVSEKKGLTFRHDGNNVDMDKEMSELAENQIYYNALTERISGKFQSLSSVIRGGK